MTRPDEYRSCASHCCIRHGCKYGHEDCPVATGKVKQWYHCEDCRDELTPEQRAAVDAIRESFSADYFEPLRRQARTATDPHNTALAPMRLLAILDEIAPPLPDVDVAAREEDR